MKTQFSTAQINAEGWALHAEAEPYEPIDGQLFALQLRLLRAARAMLDPMLNLGLTDRDTATRVLTREVCLSKAMAKQEVDRYTVNSPGQAGSCFYGYPRDADLVPPSRRDQLSRSSIRLCPIRRAQRAPISVRHT